MAVSMIYVGLIATQVLYLVGFVTILAGLCASVTRLPNVSALLFCTTANLHGACSCSAAQRRLRGGGCNGGCTFVDASLIIRHDACLH